MLLVSGLLLAAVSAGCFGGDDGGAAVQSVSTSTQTGVGNTSVSGSISAGPDGVASSGNASSDNASVAWSYDNRTGTVQGTGVPMASDSFETDESINVANGTRKLLVNLTVEGNDVTLSLRAPDCDAADCAEEVQTQGGQAALAIDTPLEGVWTAVITVEGNGPLRADYTMEIAQLVPGDGA